MLWWFYAVVHLRGNTGHQGVCALSSQKKIKIFQTHILSKAFCPFPNVRMSTNVYREEAIADHKVENTEIFRNTTGGIPSQIWPFPRVKTMLSIPVVNRLNVNVSAMTVQFTIVSNCRFSSYISLFFTSSAFEGSALFTSIFIIKIPALFAVCGIKGPVLFLCFYRHSRIKLYMFTGPAHH